MPAYVHVPVYVCRHTSPLVERLNVYKLVLVRGRPVITHRALP